MPEAIVGIKRAENFGTGQIREYFFNYWHEVVTMSDGCVEVLRGYVQPQFTHRWCYNCREFWPVRRAIGRLTRMVTASPTGTDNSVVTLLELPPRS